VVAGLTLAACASSELQVRTSYDRTASFSELKTFLVTVEADNADDMAHFYQAVRTTIVEDLTARGYAKAEGGSPDFWVIPRLSYTTSRPQPLETSAGSQVTGGPAGAGGKPKGSSLDIRVVSPDRRTELWEGTVTGFTANSVVGTDPLRQAAKRLLAEFPPLIAHSPRPAPGVPALSPP